MASNALIIDAEIVFRNSHPIVKLFCGLHPRHHFIILPLLPTDAEIRETRSEAVSWGWTLVFNLGGFEQKPFDAKTLSSLRHFSLHCISEPQYRKNSLSLVSVDSMVSSKALFAFGEETGKPFSSNAPKPVCKSLFSVIIIQVSLRHYFHLQLITLTFQTAPISHPSKLVTYIHSKRN